MQKIIRLYIYTTGVLLLATASALLLANLMPRPMNYIPIKDPIFTTNISILFWIISAITATMSLYCLYGRNPKRQLALTLWLATNALIAYLCLPLMNVKGINGYLGFMTQAFDLSAPVITILLTITLAYLLIGSATLTIFLLTHPKIKTFCSACGAHIEFSPKNTGQQTHCPLCRTPITLRKPDELIKMTCFYCQEHIKFPTHALGQKIPCPHCAKTIALKEQM